MPYNNPLAYFPPEIQQQLLGLQSAGPVESLLPALIGAAPDPAALYAAGAQGYSLPAFRRLSDDDVLRLQKGRNPRNKQDSLREELIRRQYGTWGVPGNVPIPPQLG